MRKNKAQSILEYLIVLTGIVIVICAHTFWHFMSFSRGIDIGLSNMGDAVENTVDQDFQGEVIDNEVAQAQWYAQNPIPKSNSNGEEQ